MDHHWLIEPTEEPGWIRIRNMETDLYLGAANGNPGNNIIPQQFWYDESRDDLKWSIEQYGDDGFLIINKNGQYLSITTTAMYTSGRDIRLLTARNTANTRQEWSLLPNPNDLNDIAIINEPVKTHYLLDEPFERNGLTVGMKIGDTDVFRPIEFFLLSGFDSSTVGEKTIIANYGGRVASFTIEVGIACEDCDRFPCECCEDCGQFPCVCIDPVIDTLKEMTRDILKNGLKPGQLPLIGHTLRLVLDGVDIVLSESANNRNISGEVDLGDGYFLIFDIKGNGSNVREFEVIKR